MKNQDYWDNFYNKDHFVEDAPTNFAIWTAEIAKQLHQGSDSIQLVDLGAGNCRDSAFFSKQGFKVTAIDAAANLHPKEFTYIRDSFLNVDLSGFGYYYLRFVVHAMTEADLDILMTKIVNESKDGYVFIETRSSKNITNEPRSETFFRSSIGQEHFRMLYSKEYLDAKLSKDFDIIQSNESENFAPYRGENPICLRYVLRVKKQQHG